MTASALEYRVLRPNSRFNRFEWFISQKVLPNSGLFLTSRMILGQIDDYVFASTASTRTMLVGDLESIVHFVSPVMLLVVSASSLTPHQTRKSDDRNRGHLGPHRLVIHAAPAHFRYCSHVQPLPHAWAANCLAYSTVEMYMLSRRGIQLPDWRRRSMRRKSSC